MTAVVLALAGTTAGYAALSKSVTVSLDGQPREVTAMGGTVGDVLSAEGIEVGEHDIVAPSVDEEVADGSRISVRFGRPLELSVDGKETTHWVTSTDVAAALGEIGKRFLGADLSTSRGAGIGREGMALEIVTPKKLELKIGAKKPVKRELTALTVKDALEEMNVKVDKRDIVKPGLGKELQDGDRVVFTDIRVVTKRVKAETLSFDTIEREDSSMTEGETEVIRAGKAGSRNVTYRRTYRNGELVATKVLSQKVLESPRDRIVVVGTKDPAPSVNYASGSTVWDQLAECESGGNWAINTGNGYYGGLQFSLSTWQSYGGPGYPHTASRETQIMIAERVRAADGGGYSSWPACSQALGLPQ
ncbi:transglycosylase family protein [Nocardioides sp.]|uniref:transglycosylase family protein n=1 Tax=Nocardioides sp. TaxID=35761 RepID=UPI002D80E869|nr:transglycosylase family protein [Nocardioides sp.]HET8959907.1 transglycosylase family protein [Nocardioides sp.]